MIDEYDEDDIECPVCGHTPTRSMSCLNIGCDDGAISLYDDDPIGQGVDDIEQCPECRGTGRQRWCPNCGIDLNDLGGIVKAQGEELAKLRAWIAAVPVNDLRTRPNFGGGTPRGLSIKRWIESLECRHEYVLERIPDESENPDSIESVCVHCGKIRGDQL